MKAYCDGIKAYLDQISSYLGNIKACVVGIKAYLRVGEGGKAGKIKGKRWLDGRAVRGAES